MPSSGDHAHGGESTLGGRGSNGGGRRGRGRGGTMPHSNLNGFHHGWTNQPVPLRDGPSEGRSRDEHRAPLIRPGRSFDGQLNSGDGRDAGVTHHSNGDNGIQGHRVEDSTQGVKWRGGGRGGGARSSPTLGRKRPAPSGGYDAGNHNGRARHRRGNSRDRRSRDRERVGGRGSGGNGGGGGGGNESSNSSTLPSTGETSSSRRTDSGRADAVVSGRQGSKEGGQGHETGVTFGPGNSSVVERRATKLKELEVLKEKKEVVVAAGNALAKQMERNRMEQEEIAIQIDAAKRLLVLYDSQTPPPPPPPPPVRKSPLAARLSRGGAEEPRQPSVSSSNMATPLLRRTSSASRWAAPLTPATPLSPLLSHQRADAAKRNAMSSSTTPAVTGSSGRTPALRSPDAGNTAPNGGRATGGVSSTGGASACDKSGPGIDLARRDDSRGGTALRGLANGPTFRSSSSSSSSSSSGDDDNRVRTQGSRTSLYGLITTMPEAGGARKPASGPVAEGRTAAAGQGMGTFNVGVEQKPDPMMGDGEEYPNRMAADGARGTGRAGNTVRGTEVNVGSFNILKQLMFRTTRTKKARSMVFNPREPGLFAVCSADFSVDLWQYGRSNNELHRVSARNDATPVGGAHMAWNPSGTHLAIGHAGAALVDNWAATIVGREERSRGMKLRSDRHTKPAQAVAWVTPSKNNQDHLVTGGDDGQVVIWTRVLDASSDLHKVAVLHSRHKSAVKSTCCPSISPTVCSGGADGRLVSYSIETASVEWEERLTVSNTYHPAVNELLEFPRDPNSLLVSAVDTARSHCMFRMDTRQKRSLMKSAPRMSWKRKDEKKPFSTLVYPSLSPCGHYVACAGDWNGCFLLWDVRSGRGEPMQSVLVNSMARVVHTAWHPSSGARAFMSLSNAPSAKNFALHLHGGLRS